jgi:benzylsuccinate CoA-transferase BbsF subunit
MSLNLSKPGGQQVARRLIKWADILIEAMTPGSMKRLGLDYESARKIRPDIIYVSTCMHGQYGPDASQPGYGVQAPALAGYYEVTGWPDRPPVQIYMAYTDAITPLYLVCAILVALDWRSKTSKGLYIDQAAVEAAITFLGPALLDYTVNRRIATRIGNRDPYAAPHSCYRCLGDDRWCVIVVQSDEQWNAFCRAIGKPEWSRDPKFATLLGRKENEEELNILIEKWTRNYLPEEVMFILQGAGVPAAVVQNPQDIYEDPQLKHRHHFEVLEHKVIGPMSFHSPAYRLSKTPCNLFKAGPTLGEDNEYVYKQILGYSDDEIADFIIHGVITTEADMDKFSSTI